MAFDMQAYARALRFAACLCCAVASPLLGSRASAQDATLLTGPPPADCAVVGVSDVSRLLGYAVADPDEASRSGGICAFSARSVTEEGVASYAIVTAQRLPQRRAFFIGQVRRCGSVAPDAPRAAACKHLAELASARTIDAYFAARTGSGDASPVAGLGDAAFVTADALYARRGAAVFEVVVRRGDTLDVPRTTELAKLLLSRSTAS